MTTRTRQTRLLSLFPVCLFRRRWWWWVDCGAILQCLPSLHPFSPSQTNKHGPWMTVQCKLLSIDKDRQCLCLASKDTPVRWIVDHVAYRLMAKSEKVYHHPLAERHSLLTLEKQPPRNIFQSGSHSPSRLPLLLSCYRSPLRNSE